LLLQDEAIAKLDAIDLDVGTLSSEITFIRRQLAESQLVVHESVQLDGLKSVNEELKASVNLVLF
jgi:hypothetical protein